MRFCASVNGIASAGLRLMNIACNLGNCYNISNLYTDIKFLTKQTKGFYFEYSNSEEAYEKVNTILKNTT